MYVDLSARDDMQAHAAITGEFQRRQIVQIAQVQYAPFQARLMQNVC